MLGNNCDKTMKYFQVLQYTLDKNRPMKNDFLNGQINKQTDMENFAIMDFVVFCCSLFDC